MKDKYITLFISLIVLLFLISFVYVQLSFKEEGISNTKSPKEAVQENLLLKNITSSAREIPYDDKNNLIIENAWLEKYYLRKNHIFWIKRTLDQKQYLLKISYAFKDKTTGETYKDNKKIVLLENLDSKDATICQTNVVGLLVKAKSSNDVSIKIYNGINHGINDGILVNFK